MGRGLHANPGSHDTGDLSDFIAGTLNGKELARFAVEDRSLGPGEIRAGIQMWHKRRRRHSGLGMLTPTEFEVGQQWSSLRVPFVSEAQLRTALDDAGVSVRTTDAVVGENEAARLDGLRSSLAVLALIALIALFFTRRIHQSASLDWKPHARRGVTREDGLRSDANRHRRCRGQVSSSESQRIALRLGMKQYSPPRLTTNSGRFVIRRRMGRWGMVN